MVSPAHPPSNGDIARELEALADYLAFEDESVYRILAYRKAATAFRESAASVAQLALEDRLRELPGIGPAIEGKVREYVTSGRIESLETLRARYPEGVLTLARLPGVGPKTARRLYEHLGVASMPDLERAARAELIRTVPGMGAKSEGKLLKAVEAYRAAHANGEEERRLLGVVGRQVDEVLSAMRALPEVTRAEMAGSYRRRRATIGDLDLVVASEAPVPVRDGFVGLPLVGEVIQSGETKAVVRGHNGVQIDLRVVPPASFGNLLQHATGSADHNVALRGHAQRRGLKVSEYHIEDLAGGAQYRCADEVAVYARLGLPWIPPELREDRGELQAALEGRLPQLVELEDLQGDLHVHSTWSDGKLSLEAMALAARERSLRYICFCDHSQSLGMGVGLTPDELLAQIEEVRALDARLEGIDVLAGSEVDILADGAIDFPDEVLARLDFVTASIHSGFQQPRERIMGRLLSAVEHPYVDAIGHPTGRLIGRREGYEIDVDRLASAAAETGTFLEINASYDRLDLRAEHARRARELGARMVISSDAHSARGFDLLSYGVGEARRAWLEPGDVGNTLPWRELRARLRRNR